MSGSGDSELSHKKLKLDELNRVDIESFKNQEKQSIIVVLDNIRSLNNVGTFFRTSDAFNIEKLILCGITGCPPHRDIHKTALGSTESVVWEYCEDVTTIFPRFRDTHQIYAVEQTQNSLPLHQVRKANEKGLVLIFGNEVEGVQQKVINHCNGVIEIPQFGTKHSLNVSVSLGIVLWEFTRNALLTEE